MRKHIFILIIALVSSFLTFGQKKIKIEGVVQNPADQNIVFFNFSNRLLNIPQPEPIITPIDSVTGKFFTEIPVTEKYNWILIQHGRQFTFFISPGGSSLKANILGNNLRDSISFTGKGSETANYIIEYNRNRGLLFEYNKKVQSLIGNEPKQFEIAIDSILKSDLEYIAESARKLPKDFISYWQDCNKFMNYAMRLTYPQAYMSMQTEPADQSAIDDLKNIVINTPKILDDKYLGMFSYQNYIQSYYPALLNAKGVENKLIPSALPGGQPTPQFTQMDSTFNLLQDPKHTPSKTGELASALIIAAHLKSMPASELSRNVDQYKAVYPKSENISVLDKAVYDIVKFNAGKPAIDFNFTTIEGKEMKLSDLKGKVVYLDFWASWCGPCKGQMPFAKEIKKHFEGKGVEFLYVSIDTKEDAWKNGINAMQIEGIHARTDGWGGEISKLYNISSVPAYFLIDKNGNFAIDKAPRPSQKEELIQEIEKLLN